MCEHLPSPTSPKKHVRIATLAAALSPVDVAYPIETALDGTPGLKYTRSLSRHGLSLVTAVSAAGRTFISRSSRCWNGCRRERPCASASSEARLYFDATLLTLVELPALCAWLGKARR